MRNMQHSLEARRNGKRGTALERDETEIGPLFPSRSQAETAFLPKYATKVQKLGGPCARLSHIQSIQLHPITNIPPPPPLSLALTRLLALDLALM